MMDPGTAFRDALLASLEGIELQLGFDVLESMQAHYHEVLRGNSVMNLTRIVEPAAAAVQHYADSLALLAWMRNADITAQTMLDIGSGAGFPAFPMAIACPELSVTVLEAKKKKAGFLAEAATTLDIPNLRVVQEHSAHWRGEERFDLVTFRAVAAVAPCLAMGDAHVGEHGTIAVYKTARMTDPEQLDGRRAGKTLKLRTLAAFPYRLKAGEEAFARQLLLFRPTGPR
ncbi:MAG: 16S rRNA (guanine(527)-N(7))-methyltransferase RsmG [Phycisphaerae bacterium]